MKKIILSVLLASLFSAAFAWTDQPYVVTSDSGKTVNPVKLTAGAKDLGSVNNPLWTRSTVVDGSGRTVTAFGSSTVTLSVVDAVTGDPVSPTAQSVSNTVKALDVNIAAIGTSTIMNANYVTQVAGVNVTLTGSAMIGWPDVISEGITLTAEVLEQAFKNKAGLNVTITASGTLITQNLYDNYLDTISAFKSVTKTGNVTNTNGAGWYNIKTGAKKMYLTINGTNPTASSFTVNIYRNATPSAVNNTITAYSLNGNVSATTVHNVYYGNATSAAGTLIDTDFLYSPDNCLWDYNQLIVLLPSTNYLINIVPSVTQAVLGIRFKWYEF